MKRVGVIGLVLAGLGVGSVVLAAPPAAPPVATPAPAPAPAPAPSFPPPPLPPAVDVSPALTGGDGAAAIQSDKPEKPDKSGKSGKSGTPGKPEKPEQPMEILGFRSAHFGMTESEVRAAIRLDFNASGGDVVSASDDLEKTTSLQIMVDDLLSVAGKARISYVFGFHSKTLTQVNLAWGAAAGVDRSSEALVDAADMLRAHFLEKPFRQDNMLLNWQLSDGSTVVFRGLDYHRHMILLVLAGEKLSSPTDGGGAPLVPALKITTLMLSYVESIDHPDDFHLKPEAF